MFSKLLLFPKSNTHINLLQLINTILESFNYLSLSFKKLKISIFFFSNDAKIWFFLTDCRFDFEYHTLN